jgi:hypothetical protein
VSDLVRPFDVINGRARWMWVRDAARSLEAVVHAGVALNIVGAGIDEFIRQARPRFEKAVGVRFSEDELRWMFRRLAAKLAKIPRLLEVGHSESGVSAADIIETNSVRHGDVMFEARK